MKKIKNFISEDFKVEKVEDIVVYIIYHLALLLLLTGYVIIFVIAALFAFFGYVTLIGPYPWWEKIIIFPISMIISSKIMDWVFGDDDEER